MTRLRHIAAIATAAFVAACTGKDTGNVDSSSAQQAMRVALLTPGSIADQSWNSGAYKGLLAIRDSLGAQISHVETRTPTEFEENFRQYGTQEYDLVFGHGFEYQDAAARVAPQFPNTKYVVTSGRVTAPNVAGVAFAFEQASYQAGIVAGMMTKSNIIGLIGGQELPPVVASFTAFQRGAKSVNPKVRFLISYLGNWEDPNAGKEQALAQISRGADIVLQNTNAASLGIFQAVRERKVLTFGANVDQNGVAPDVIIGSVMIDLPAALLRIAREVQSGTFEGRVIDFGVKENIVRFVVNPQLRDRIPAQALAASDSVGREIVAGNFHALDDILAGADKAKPIGK